MLELEQKRAPRTQLVPDRSNENVTGWLAALEKRHLADLRLQEVTRALRALSSSYVERRGGLARSGPLNGAGKRAAFALYYAPLHFLITRCIVDALDAALRPPSSIVDIGCGTGAAGAAWAVAAAREPSVLGIDRHPWAVAEARWTYHYFELRGRARQGDASRLPPPRAGNAVLAAFAMNELPAPERGRLEQALITGAGNGARVLIIEPIARSVTPWWDSAVERFASVGGRADEWRFRLDLPPLLRTLDKAAGLRHDELTARSLYCAGA